MDMVVLHQAIVGAIRRKFPGLNMVEAYREDRASMLTPACLVELIEMEAADELDPGTEQLAVNAKFEARIVLGFRQGEHGAKLGIRQWAAELAVFVNQQRWGLPVGAADVTGCWPDEFDSELGQYECWRVEWQQVIRLGASVWTDEGQVPEPYLAWAPEVGTEHEADYRPVTGGR